MQLAQRTAVRLQLYGHALKAHLGRPIYSLRMLKLPQSSCRLTALLRAATTPWTHILPITILFQNLGFSTWMCTLFITSLFHSLGCWSSEEKWPLLSLCFLEFMWWNPVSAERARFIPCSESGSPIVVKKQLSHTGRAEEEGNVYTRT